MGTRANAKIKQMDCRSPKLAAVREYVDDLQRLCDNIRRSYPLRYPVPLEVDQIFTFEEDVLAKVRDGRLREVALNA